jgi:hypothetical protein
MDPTLETMRKLARSWPDTSEGVACEGTPIERRTIKVKGNAFVFLGASDAMFKLKLSLPEAKGLAARAPDRCRVGAIGWVTVAVRDDALTPAAVLRKWLEESYGLQAGGRAKAKKPAKAKAKPKPKRTPRKKKAR